MTNIKPIGASADKWSRRSSGATGDYSTGVQNPRKSWATAAKAGEKNYAQGVTQSIARGGFGKGVSACGDAGWQKGATTKGPGRYAEGVTGAQGDWTDGYQPYQTTMASLTLPDRGPKGSTQNLQRVNLVATAMRGTFEKKG